jgi:hypothetical protein
MQCPSGIFWKYLGRGGHKRYQIKIPRETELKASKEKKNYYAE